MKKQRFKRIIQLVGAFHVADATGNQIVIQNKIFSELGFDTLVVSPTIDPPLKNLAEPIEKFKDIYDPESDLLWLHYNLISPLSDIFANASGRKVLVFHNITPAGYFAPYHAEITELLLRSEDDLRSLSNRANLAVGVSKFNCLDLKRWGFKHTEHIPLVFEPKTYPQQGNKVIEEQYDDGICNILFVGRVVPNKRIENLIRCFAVFKRRLRTDSRLIIVGKYNPGDHYYRMLLRLLGIIGIEQVIFTGTITQEELVSYYRIADLFLSFSEHEGFFMPLLEAYHFSVPVLALRAGAISETAQGGALLFDEPDPFKVALMTKELIEDESMVSHLRLSGKKRLKDFEYQSIKTILKGVLSDL